jgi:hypothetical protein
VWNIIPSFAPIVEALAPAFTQPSATTSCQLLLGWIMCLGRHTLRRAAETVHPQTLPDHAKRHDLDNYYNFFERSAWTPGMLAYRLAVLLVGGLQLFGSITLLVDDTLIHKRGRCVWGVGWWRDAVASTKKRVATASGHNWVVVAIAYCPPWPRAPILALPLLARLHQPGKDQPSCPTLAKRMLAEVLSWFPERRFTLVGDGAYACKELLDDLDERVVFVGRMRGDAALFDPDVPMAKKGKRGPKARKGPRLPSPREAAEKADRKRTKVGEWLWQAVEVTIYGKARSLRVVSYRAVWPRVRGLHPIMVHVVRDTTGKMDEVHLFTTDVEASAQWVIMKFASRWTIEVLFKSSKQVGDIGAPQHWCQASVEKVAPWVWSMQSVVVVWYVTAGRELPETVAARKRLGEWESEWSLGFMFKALRGAILDATINPMSADIAKLTELLQTLKNCVHLAG